MAFKIPEVERSSPQETAPVGRIDVQAPNLAAATAPMAKATDNLVESAGKNYVKYVQDVADTEGLRASNEMDRYLIDALDGDNGVKRQKGDPYALYDQLEKNEESKFTAIRERYKDAGSETRAAVEKKLIETRLKFYDRKVTAKSVQVNAYEDGITKDKGELLKNDMMDNVAHLDINDPSATMKLQGTISEIQNLHINRGLKNGAVKEKLDAEGNFVGYDMQPSVKLAIVKDTSEGLYQAISNLAKSGDVEGAKFLQEKYGVYLDARNKEKSKDVIEKEGLDSEAYVKAIEISRSSPEAQEAALGKITNPKLAEKTRTKLDSIARQRQNLQDRNEKKNYADAGKIVLNRMQSDSPFTTVDQMESDPTVKRLLGYMNPKQRMALQSMVTQPKESDQEALGKAYQKLNAGEFRGLSYEDLQQDLAGLNKADRNKMTTKWSNLNSETGAEENQKIKSANSMLMKSLIVNNYVKHNQFGKFDNKNESKLYKAQQELTDALEDRGPMTQKELQDFVVKFAASKKADTAFDVEEAAPKRFKGTVDLSGKKKTAEKVYDMDAKKKATVDFIKEKGRSPNVQTELLPYMNQKGTY